MKNGQVICTFYATVTIVLVILCDVLLFVDTTLLYLRREFGNLC